jgi:hypothetical protein
MTGYQDAIRYWVTPINPGGYWITTYQPRRMRTGAHQT